MALLVGASMLVYSHPIFQISVDLLLTVLLLLLPLLLLLLLLLLQTLRCRR
jgi:hypothetical protein